MIDAFYFYFLFFFMVDNFMFYFEMVSIVRYQIDHFTIFCHRTEQVLPQEFNEGDVGLAGGIQVNEPANANLVTEEWGSGAGGPSQRSGRSQAGDNWPFLYNEIYICIYLVGGFTMFHLHLTDHICKSSCLTWMNNHLTALLF